MSDRIAVVNNGVIEQCAGPREIYEHPATAFVAGFIGTSNLVRLRIDRSADGCAIMDVAEGQRIVAPASSVRGSMAQITVRPEKIRLDPEGLGENATRVGGRVHEVVYLGSMTQIMVDLATGDQLTVNRLNDEVATATPKAGDTVTLHWAAENSFVIAGTPAAAEEEEGSALTASA